MGEAYFNLKLKLEGLGYNNALPIDAVPLVECIIADLLQTTRSLQHYMDLSKDALMERDSLMMEAEPYRCDNARLIQDNNRLHREMIDLQDEIDRIFKDSKRKIKSLSDELSMKDSVITKLQHDVRDLSLRGLCAETQSSRNKSRRKDAGDAIPKTCICNDRKVSNHDRDIEELTKKIILLEQQNESYCDEINLLRSQVEHRDNEIIRLNILLEGGKAHVAIKKDGCNKVAESKIKDLRNQLHEVQNNNEVLKKELGMGLEKQHEAMLRALSLADKNKLLQEEMQKVDTLALKVEEDCNKRLAAMMNDLHFLQSRIEGLTVKNSELQMELSKKQSAESSFRLQQYQESLNIALKEKEALHKEIKDLVDQNKSLQDKILTQAGKVDAESERSEYTQNNPTKNELQILLEDKRKKYEKCIEDMQAALNKTMTEFNTHLLKCKERDLSPKGRKCQGSAFVRDLHNKLCESEQKMLMLKTENEELKSQISKQDESKKLNFQDIISQLNAENAELSKENIALSQQLHQYKHSGRYNERKDNSEKDITQKFKDEIESLTREIIILRKDKQEYNYRYKEALDLADKLKRDLACKQRDVEILQEENSSYKMTSRHGKASADHLKEECYFLKEQIKQMQTDVIKEKSLASQIRNIQLETERSSNEVQNELLCAQRQLKLSKDTNEELERKCKELQSEIMALKIDKSNLFDSIKKVDQERDKLVIELDHKTEDISVLEQKLTAQNFEVSKLDNEISELTRKLNMNRVSEHKLEDNDTQIKFLNGEIARLSQQFENAVIENKHLQNSLADVNGTLKLTKIEYDKSRKEVDGLKLQLQHYVEEIRRIEDMLSHKEAERSDMLEHFASLSVEANILENTNHSLENESASKTLKLQTYINKIESLESKLLDKENIIESQSTRIATMTCKITSLENEIKLISEEKAILEQNVAYLKKMCNNFQLEQTNTTADIANTDSELKLYENKIKSLSKAKANLEEDKNEISEKLMTTEKLLSNARREIVELKLALQDATAETQSLQGRVSRLSRRHSQIQDTTLTNEELELPLLLEETIHEVSHEEDEDSSRYHEVRKRYSKYTHGSTL